MPTCGRLPGSSGSSGTPQEHLSPPGLPDEEDDTRIRTKMPGSGGVLGGAAYRNRTDALCITRGTIPSRAGASCTDSTGNRTDGTHGAGITRRPGPRIGPRPRSWARRILLLCVNAAGDTDPRSQADGVPGPMVDLYVATHAVRLADARICMSGGEGQRDARAANFRTRACSGLLARPPAARTGGPAFVSPRVDDYSPTCVG